MSHVPTNPSPERAGGDQTMHDTTTTRSERPQLVALWATAAGLALLILAQAGGLFDASARADMTAAIGGISMMTTRSGNQEPLFVVDDRTETLYVYKTGQDKCELWDKQNLPELFTSARTRYLGKP
ncbi:MAG: hypothetical protein R3B57_12850 [Phycisphaerales bacterium]